MKYLSDIGINKAPENGDLDVDGDIYSNGERVSVATKYVDANGWNVYDMGSFKIYKKTLNPNTGVIAGGTNNTYNLSTPPTGLSIDLDYSMSWTIGTNPHWFTVNPTKTATHLAINVHNRAGSGTDPQLRVSIMVVE